MIEEITHLPDASKFSPSVIRFLGEQFCSQDDLSRSSNIESELKTRCSDLDIELEDLRRQISERIDLYSARTEKVREILDGIGTGLFRLRCCCVVSDESGSRRKNRFTEELPALAKEVARVETVRAYAEMASKLDKLIGEVEEASSYAMAGKLSFLSVGSVEESRQLAISSLKKTEDLLVYITKSRPQWVRLVSAVDNRVDRALAILRPHAIADHRSLLSSLGWPPKLSTFINTTDTGKSMSHSNPLTTMKGDLKDKYCDNFLALCNLQELQRQRKFRQLQGYNLEVSLHQPLWAIEELVTPIAFASQNHFSKWIEKPEFIFALVYKITRDFVHSMDEILQPLVDEARLLGYSCREEWIAAIVTSLCIYLAKEVLPAYISQLNDETSSSVSLQARIAWLNLIDSMISFDKRIQTLITSTGLLLSVNDEDSSMQRISSLYVFCDRPDWLDIWAEMELRDALDKLKPELENEKTWGVKMEVTTIFSGLDDYKSPIISNFVFEILSILIDRSRPIPSFSLRSRFVKLVGGPILQKFTDALLHRCQEAEGLTALADDDALIKVCDSINAARYGESMLMQWSEDVFFLEMATSSSDNSSKDEKSIFEDEIHKFREFHKEWREKISSVILRGFDARSCDYLKNRKQWQEKEDGGSMSMTFIDALDYLQGKISKMQESLNEVDFVGLWRSLACGVDRMIFMGTLGSNSKFYNGGCERFRSDLEALFGVFRAWCLRPDGFFPRLSEGLSLLKMEEKDLKEALLDGNEKLLKSRGLRHLNIFEAEKIARNRVFTG